MIRLRHILLLAVVWALVPGADARADWLITPFIGTTFGVGTSLITPDTDALSAKHVTFGGSGLWLTDNVLGLEGDLALTPGFFEGDNAFNLVASSNVTTLFGNVIAAVPLSVSRDSLRPYLVGGVGLIHVNLEDQIGLVESDNHFGLQLGGGAIGLVSDRLGVRFDLRQVRTLSRGTSLRGERATKLSFWRASIGVVVRY